MTESEKSLFNRWVNREATCSICSQTITLSADPQLLPCCHTACLDCVRNVKVQECRICSKPFNRSTVSRNLFLLYDQLGASHDDKLIKKMIEEVHSCSTHKQPLDMFCNVCLIKTCKECLIGPHFDHFQKVERMQAIYEQFRTNLSDWTKTYADKQLMALKGSHLVLNSKAETLKLKQAEIVYRIRECERHVSIAINRQFNRLTKEVISVINREHVRLNEIKLQFDGQSREMSEMNGIVSAITEQNCVPALIHHSRLINDYLTKLSSTWPKVFAPIDSDLQMKLTCSNVETINQEILNQVNRLIQIEIYRAPMSPTDITSKTMAADTKPKQILKRSLEEVE